MKKLIPVEDARALMTEAQAWSVWRWLTEKKKVRAIADKATAALNEENERIKCTWSDDVSLAYNEALAEAAVNGDAAKKRAYESARKDAAGVDAKVRTAAKKAKEADDAGYRATMDAEEMFVAAERRMSAGMAREAAQKALESYDLREDAIRKAESAARL